MNTLTTRTLTETIGAFPYRMALAGGWIDQPFVSRLNPARIGSMVVVGLEPTCRFMERAGIATGTRNVALQLWNGRLPDRDPAELVRELYAEENRGKTEPSGSQDMIGLIYPGVNRLDYDFAHEGGFFPRHIESNNDPVVARWLEQVIHFLPIAPARRLQPAGRQESGSGLDPTAGRHGPGVFRRHRGPQRSSPGASMNACMDCWEAILPQTVRHPAITTDLKGLLAYYQSRYCGAMYSGCGGGYLFVVSTEPVPGAFQINVRIAKS